VLLGDDVTTHRVSALIGTGLRSCVGARAGPPSGVPAAMREALRLAARAEISGRHWHMSCVGRPPRCSSSL
jgi:hypothetical protein